MEAAAGVRPQQLRPEEELLPCGRSQTELMRRNIPLLVRPGRAAVIIRSAEWECGGQVQSDRKKTDPEIKSLQEKLFILNMSKRSIVRLILKNMFSSSGSALHLNASPDVTGGAMKPKQPQSPSVLKSVREETSPRCRGTKPS
ncbi:uncharacterized protein V6R79_024482 [Siganus canaliculatus]